MCTFAAQRRGAGRRTRSAHWAIVASGGHHDLGLNDIGVHAHLRVMVQRHQCPVGDSARHIARAGGVCLHDQVLHSCCIEQLDIGCLHTVQPTERLRLARQKLGPGHIKGASMHMQKHHDILHLFQLATLPRTYVAHMSTW